MTQRDGIGREMGGGFRMGNTCTPVADSCQCMAKPVQYCKVKKKNLIFLKRKKSNGNLTLRKMKPRKYLPGGSVDKNLPANAGDTGSILGPGRPHIPQSK